MGSTPGQLQTSTTTDAATIHVASVSRTFPTGVTAIDSLSLDIAVGSFIALIGPSGCGKSTLLRMLAGLDEPTSGTITGIDRDRIAYVFQDAHLMPWRSVLRNVTLPLELLRQPPVSGATGWYSNLCPRDEHSLEYQPVPPARLSRLDRIAAAHEALARVGLSEAAARYPAELSGGMRMRASLARAIVSHPKVLLLDEPFAALDEISRHALDEMLRRLWLETGMTVAFVTHSIAEATFLADRAIVFSKRPARIMLDTSIDLPRVREHAVRVTPQFSGIEHTLFNALQRGQAL